MLRDYCKYLVTLAGAKMSQPRLNQIQTFANQLHIGAWARQRHYTFAERKRDRTQVWSEMVSRIEGRKVLYLEFGVAAGDSIRWWAQALKDPQATLHGFDSFEGLPEQNGPWFKGQFDAQGRAPALNDQRVTFFKGWFDQVLPTYTPPAHDLLVVNMDADLYSSTIFVLRWLRPLLKPGTLIYFDEMDHVDHEPRAIDEFTTETGWCLRPLAADWTLAHSSFEFVK
ncbi:MAG TPA: class I SAM-dependent methyltransferase [Verrucomicrobiae bacterium]|jgi:predicted O-methyltransferase YrrM|nr:class I SAM-dependent methyltransferase [Verrucomicrobiae bacterium]